MSLLAATESTGAAPPAPAAEPITEKLDLGASDAKTAPATIPKILSSEEIKQKMREQLPKSTPTSIKVSDKEKVNMKLASACSLLWCIKVDGGYDIALKTSWAPEGGGASTLGGKDYGRVMEKKDMIKIPGPGTYSLTLDNSYAWVNTKTVKLTYVTAAVGAEAAGNASAPAAQSAQPAAAAAAPAPVVTQQTPAPVAAPAPAVAIVSAAASWDVASVGQWLGGADLDKFAEKFAAAKIDGRCLARLKDFTAKDQADYMQDKFGMDLSEALTFGHELGKL